MDETTQFELKRILNKFQDKANKESEEYEKRDQEAQRYKREFPRVVHDIIRPTMEEIGTYIKGLGHKYEIKEYVRTNDQDDLAIRMEIVPPPILQLSSEVPRITFSIFIDSVMMERRPYASEDKLRIEDITKKLVEKNILEVMEACEKKTFK
jgi:hypothetical protein